MSLSIKTTNAQIGINITPAKLDYHISLAKINLHQQHAQVQIDTELPKVQIDQYECFASAGIKNLSDMTKEAAQKARQNVLNYIGKTVADGKRLAHIELGENPIPDFAARDAFPRHEYGLGFIPKARPKIDVVGGTVDISAEQDAENGVDTEYIPGNFDITYTPYSVRTYMLQYPSISISYQGNTIDTHV